MRTLVAGTAVAAVLGLLVYVACLRADHRREKQRADDWRTAYYDLRRQHAGTQLMPTPGKSANSQATHDQAVCAAMEIQFKESR